MRKYLLTVYVLTILAMYNYSQTNDSLMPEKISKTEIKSGEKITLTINAPNLENAKVLWEEMYSSPLNAEIFSKKNIFKGKNLFLEIIFTIFETGRHDKFNFTIPVIQSNGEIAYITTDSYTINVLNPLTNEELENIKNIKDPSVIQLKDEKPQAKIPFLFSFYMKILLLILIIIILAFASYYFFYKYIMKKKGENFENIPPFQIFLIRLERIIFYKNDERKETEKKLSELTEALKELIYNDFSFNAPSETTRELIVTLRNKDFQEKIIVDIKYLFDEIDLIKFAKAPIIFEKLKDYFYIIKSLGIKIHDFKLSLMSNQEVIDENIQT